MTILHKQVYDILHKKRMHCKILRHEKQYLCKVVSKGSQFNCGFLSIYGEIRSGDTQENYFVNLDYRFETFNHVLICLKRFDKDYRVYYTCEDVKWTRFST